MNVQRIGVIADTHGLLRPEACEALQGSSLIIHAGDVGKPEVPEGLERLAPVAAVRGNVAREAWCRSLPRSQAAHFIETWELHGTAGGADLSRSMAMYPKSRLASFVLIPISVNQDLEGFPRTGLWAYARTPVLGLLPV